MDMLKVDQDLKNKLKGIPNKVKITKMIITMEIKKFNRNLKMF